MAATCPVCGYDASSVSPSDAAIALRSFPRRYRGVLVRPEEDDDREDPVRRPGASGWSALAHAAYAADGIRATDEALRATIVRDHPAVEWPDADPPVPAAAGTVTAVLDRLRAAAEGAATTIENGHGKEWGRTASTADGRTVSARDLAAHAVHLGVHHLRQAEAVLREVVGRP